MKFVRITDDSTKPSSYEPSRDGIGYEVEGEDEKGDLWYFGTVAQIGFYSGTWTALTPLGSFVGEFDTRREAAAGLEAHAKGK